MKISELSISRPVLATVMSLVIVLLGAVSYTKLTMRAFPKIDPPVVTVTTSYKGAGAEIIETQVTTILEDVLSGVENLDFMDSISRSEQSQVTLVFKLEQDPDDAAADVRDRVSRVRGRLPDDIDEPVIMKVEADATPIIYLTFASEQHTTLELTDYIDRYIKDRLVILPGVADVQANNDRYAMRIWLDRNRMAAQQITTEDVERALLNQNIELPAGRIESQEREFTVLTESDLSTPSEFADIILREADGYLVRLKDVGRVEIGSETVRQEFRNNGVPGAFLGIVKQATANPIEVSDAVYAELEDIKKDLPEGVSVNTSFNSTVFLKRSISAVFITIGEAIGLVVLVIFLFLRTCRATIIPLVTIPVSLIGALSVMYALDFSINRLTLLAMALAVGLVVDDAIVMLENIQRHIEAGMKPIAAAFKGAQEIGFAIIAMTLTLAAVYVPIAFTPGESGKLFIEFAITLAGAVLISGFVALTLTPMMCSRILKPNKPGGGWKISRAMDAGMSRLTASYRNTLHRLFRARPVIILIMVGVAVGGFFLYRSLPQELSPLEDRSRIMVWINGPEGSTLEYTMKYVERLEQLFLAQPEIENVFSSIGWLSPSQGILFNNFVLWEDRERSTPEIAEALRAEIQAVPGVFAFPILPQGLSSRGVSRPVEFKVQTTASYAELAELVDTLIERASENPGLSNIDVDLKLNKPELKIDINRSKVADIGTDVATIGRTLATMLGGRNVTRFKRDGEEYEVILQVADVDRRNPDDLTSIYIRGGGGEMTQLSNLVTVRETVVPRELNHFNKLRSATITANLMPGYSLGEALEYLETTLREIDPAARYDFGGLSRQFRESSAGIFLTFILALLFIYLVLAAQFESFVDPLIILISVPLAIAGALLGLKLLGGTLNIFSQIGLVTLIGLISKHGILIVEFSNQLQERGYSAHDAVVEAAGLRLRPILMTTCAMILGALPLALATGAGAETRHQIGWVVGSGLLFGTLLTLFVVPVVYTYLSRKRQVVQTAEIGAGQPAE